MTNSRYRCVIVAAGGVLGCLAIGGMFSLPVFLQPIALDTPVTDQPVSRTIGCKNTGNENMPPIATHPSKPPAATITQR